jgi:glycosyltransferase involved in cell wall biosynthesis
MSAGVLFSVIVPTYRRTEPLKRLLAALVRQDFPASKFEVLIVDDGGGAPVEDLVSPYAGSLGIRLLRRGNAGPAAARNPGAAHVRGRYLAFTDDDCRPESGWLSALDRAFASAPEALAGGTIVNGVEGNLFSEATELLFDYLYLRYNPISVRGGFFLANNMAVPREAFLAVGGMDASMRFGEDRELCHRWAA